MTQAYEIQIENTGENFRCTELTTVLGAMVETRRKGIPVGCRNGGCGVCKIQVLQGQYSKRKMSRAVVSDEDESSGFVLACRIHPRSDLRIRVIGRMVRTVVAECGASPGRELAVSTHLIHVSKEI